MQRTDVRLRIRMKNCESSTSVDVTWVDVGRAETLIPEAGVNDKSLYIDGCQAQRENAVQAVVMTKSY